MQYIYDVLISDKRVETTTNFDSATSQPHTAILVHCANGDSFKIFSKEEEEEHRSGLEKAWSWTTLKKAKTWTKVNPKHYKGYIGEYQWLEAMARIPRYRDKSKFIAAVELQARKYLDRNGKDDNVTEFGKASFYLLFAYMYLKTGTIPSAEDIHRRME